MFSGFLRRIPTKEAIYSFYANCPYQTGVEFLAVLCCQAAKFQILTDSDPNCFTPLIFFLIF